MASSQFVPAARAKQRPLNNRPLPADKTCVLYVMVRDQRLHDNQALAYAQQRALELQVPLAVVFCLRPRTGQRAREINEHMMAGLQAIEAALAERNIPLIMLIGEAEERLKGLMYHCKPQLVVFDGSPLRGPRGQRRLRQRIADHARCAVIEVSIHDAVGSPQQAGTGHVAVRVKCHPYPWPGVVMPLAELQALIDDTVGHPIRGRLC